MNKTLKLNILALVLSLAFLAGCGTMQKAGNSISSWWSKPTTQENVQNLKEAVFSIAVAAGTEAVSELGVEVERHGANMDRERPRPPARDHAVVINGHIR